MNYSKIILTLIITGSLMACSSQKVETLENRVARLEDQVSKLQNQVNQSSASSQTAATQAARQQPQQAQTQQNKPQGGDAAFQFEETNYNFGEIQEGNTVEHVFQFKNVGDAPLKISKADASCGCTVPSWPKEPIPVGETGEIQVKFDSKNKSGVQNKRVTLTANTSPARTILRIKGTVVSSNN